jgi:redox-sensitive bicupin YhaK (pirin superfamily)
VLEISPSRAATVGTSTVFRALPQRHRRTVGAWCFADHFGPTGPGDGLSIGPHPHNGLHTVTWLLEGELVHHDSLGSEQPIRPGELNLMTAGQGVAHSEETPSSYRGGFHGMQLWVAQPEEARHGAAAFEHSAELPQIEVGAAVATVLLGEFAGAQSSARTDTAIVGADLVLSPGVHELPLRPDFEYALVLFNGAVGLANEIVQPGALAYLGSGRDSVTLHTDVATRALLLGGEPFPEPVLMWWNFVARTRDEIELATKEWNAESERFGVVRSGMDRIPAPPVPWQT